MVAESVESRVWPVGRHKGRCHLFDMVFGGGAQQWAIGISAPGVVPLADRFTEGAKHSDPGGFFKGFHEGVGAEFKLVGKFDPAAQAPIGLLMGVGDDSMFSCQIGSIEWTQDRVSGLTGQIRKFFGNCSGQWDRRWEVSSALVR